MRTLADKLGAGELVVTAELTPPKGTDLTDLLAKARSLHGWVDAFNLTESPRALMAVSPVAAGRILLEHGVETIVQMTARDRNRIAIQSDLLGAAVLGLRNFVFMGGDPPARGDHPEAKAVFDLTASQMLAAAAALAQGRDLAGKPLRGTPQLLIGATVNPGAADLEAEVTNTQRKITAGAQFLQTQAIYDIDLLERFLEAARPDGVAVLAGIIPLKSAGMGAWLNDNVPGIQVPQALLQEMAQAKDPDAELERAIAIAARTIRAALSRCAGVHVMALGWEAHLPAILARAGVRGAHTPPAPA